MDALGIERFWLFTWEAPYDEYGVGDHRFMSPHKVGIGFDETVRAMDLYPDRFVPGWAIDPAGRRRRTGCGTRWRSSASASTASSSCE